MAEELRFDGQVAVITGAGRGLGRAYAMLLASRGARVLVNDLGGGPLMTGSDLGPAEEVVAEITAAGGAAAANGDSVATCEGATAIVQEALDRWGRVDILINNAGGGQQVSTIDTVDEGAMRMMFETHVYGAFFTCGAVWPTMVSQGAGRILNTSSGASLGLSAEYPYAAAKAALLGLTNSLAVDGAPLGIKVNALLPMAYTRLVELIPSEKVRTWMREHFGPELVAPVAAALVHDSVPFTGEAISAGGGRVARVFFGVNRGFVDPVLTPESVLANLSTVMSTDGFVVASQTADELQFLMDLGAAESDPNWSPPSN